MQDTHSGPLATPHHDSIQGVLDGLRPANRGFAARFPGETDARQAVHTVYGGAHLFRADSGKRLGELALRAMSEYAPTPEDLAQALGFNFGTALASTVHQRVTAKLQREAVEDFRIDFEDGYGNRPDAEEDACADSAAVEVARGLAGGTLPPFVGIRVKPMNDELCGRSARTLERFIGALLKATGGALPPNFVVTIPKVVIPEQVSAVVSMFEVLESRHKLASGTLKLELMVETPQSIIGPDGRCALPGLVAAAHGRCVAAHFGVYDYTASCRITAEHQHMRHPACDFARHVMQVALAGTGVAMSDGATNIMPVGPHKAPPGGALTPQQRTENTQSVHRAWRLHYQDVRHSLVHAFYQGWDLHPAQLVTRYAALYTFFLESLPQASARLSNFIDKAAQATLVGDVFDDAATGQGLLNFFLRALNCGAISEDEALRTGLTLEELRGRSFARIVARRTGRG